MIKMKKTLHYIFPAMLLGSAFLSSCKKEITDRTALYPALAPANIDLNADTWKPVLVTDFSTLSVAAPDALTSPAYVADINEIKALQRGLTDDQKATIKYWSAGSVLRWNEILRDLV